MTPATRTAAGLLAAIILGGMALALPGGGLVQQRAIVTPSQTFSLTQPEPGLYQWSLSGGPAPEGAAVITRGELLVDRGDQVELTLTPGLLSGATVGTDTPLAELSSARFNRQVVVLQARLTATQARRDRLEQGGNIEISAARQRVRVAQARRAQTRTELTRIESLHTQGAASDADLNNAQLADRVSQTEVSLAQAEVEVAGSASQPAGLAVIDAEMTGIAAQLEELNDLSIEHITSPITGQLALAGSPELITVSDTSILYARFPVSERLAGGLSIGDTVRFTSTAGQLVDGELVTMSRQARTLHGEQVFWACATLASTDAELLPGNSGTIQFASPGYTGGVFGSLWRKVVGP